MENMKSGAFISKSRSEIRELDVVLNSSENKAQSIDERDETISKFN